MGKAAFITIAIAASLIELPVFVIPSGAAGRLLVRLSRLPHPVQSLPAARNHLPCPLRATCVLPELVGVITYLLFRILGIRFSSLVYVVFVPIAHDLV
jgi:hypothetical protein